MKDNYFQCDNFTWDKIDRIEYKPSSEKDKPTFDNVMRQNIFKGEDAAAFDVRYFECGLEGHTTLEKHEHVHIVVVLRGTGTVIVENEIYTVNPFDMIKIPAWHAHQLINTGLEPFGFLCTVNSKRDTFKLLTEEEVEKLKEMNPQAGKLLRITEGYFIK